MTGQAIPGKHEPGGRTASVKRPWPAIRGMVALKGGISDSPESLLEWLGQTGKSKNDSRRNIAVILKNEKGYDVAAWRFAGAWPSKYHLPDLIAKGNDVAIETLEIVHEGMERVTDSQTEFTFVLPKGYMDPEGCLHREGVMRLATAADEIQPLKDARVQSNPAYLTIILLSRVITRLGDVEPINPVIIENLFAEDIAYLQELYNKINNKGTGTVNAVCPNCEHSFEVETKPGE
jgi:phage tail-like protein